MHHWCLWNVSYSDPISSYSAFLCVCVHACICMHVCVCVDLHDLTQKQEELLLVKLVSDSYAHTHTHTHMHTYGEVILLSDWSRCFLLFLIWLQYWCEVKCDPESAVSVWSSFTAASPRRLFLWPPTERLLAKRP